MTNTPFLTRKELAQRLRVSPRTLVRMDARGLPHLRLSAKKTLYDYDKVLSYLENSAGKEGHEKLA